MFQFKIIIFTVILLFTSTVFSKDIEKNFKWICKNPGFECADSSNDDCDLYAVKNEKINKLVLHSDRHGMCRSNITSLSKDLIKIYISNGSYCGFNSFYDLKTNRVATSYSDVFAVEPTKKLAIVLTDRGVELSSIFDNDALRLLVPMDKLYSDTAIYSQAIEKATFNKHCVSITYFDKPEHTRTVVFSIDNF